MHIDNVQRVIVASDQVLIAIAGASDGDSAAQEIRVPWLPKPKNAANVEESRSLQEGTRNESLIQSMVRAHVWMQCLRNKTYESIEVLAEENGLHPKVIRLALRLAFLAPDVTSAILDGRQPARFSLAQIPRLLPLSWGEHRRLLD